MWQIAKEQTVQSDRLYWNATDWQQVPSDRWYIDSFKLAHDIPLAWACDCTSSNGHIDVFLKTTKNTYLNILFT